MSRQHHKRRRHRRPKGREPDLAAQVRRQLDANHPLDLLIGASQYLEVMRPRPTDALTGRSGASIDTFFDSLLGVDSRETTALLHALQALLPRGEHRTAEIRRELERRRWPLPAFVRGLEDFRISEIVELTHVLADGDNVMVSVEWSSGAAMTLVVYIDHNLGSIVKDAFPIPEPMGRVVDLQQQDMDADSYLGPIDPADARARIMQGIEEAERMFPPITSETWPSCRAIVEMVARRLPEGGTGYTRPEWSERDEASLVSAFLASDAGRSIRDDGDTADIVQTLIWFAVDYGPGDPLRWSPVSVEIVMTDWFPRKIRADRRYMGRMPDVLRAFIRYAHGMRSIPAHLTEETLDAVTRWEPDYRRAAASPPRSPLDLVLSAHGFDDHAGDTRSIEEIMMESLAEQAGGTDALDALDTEPLPDEPFDWAGIPEDVHDRVNEVLALADACCDDLLDVEYRTIVRRLLARVAAGDPGVFRRRGRADTAAAALVWMAGSSNDLFHEIAVKDVQMWFGLKSSPSARAATFAKAAGLPHSPYGRDPLGDPAYLHSAKRRSMIEWRDRYRERMAGGSGDEPYLAASAGRLAGGTEPAGLATSAPTVHRLKVTLRSIRPPIWRRIAVKSDTTLRELSPILEAAMGWTGAHLHLFEIGGRRYGQPDPDSGIADEDEAAHTIADVLTSVGAKMRWDYDFGDGWEHDVVVEAIGAADSAVEYPVCLTGKRACPPEDCGGPWGYGDLLEALGDETNPEHRELVEWAPAGFDPEHFVSDEHTAAMRQAEPLDLW